MAGSAFGLHIRQSLLGDLITSSQLNTLLADGNYIAGLINLLNTPSSLKMILGNETALNILLGSSLGSAYLFDSPETMDIFADNDRATEILMRNSTGLVSFTSKQVAIASYNYSQSRRDRINQYINETGYKLKRQNFTANGTFTYSDTLAKLSILAVGAGGNGSNVSVGGQVGQGGGGGEIVNIIQTSSFLASGATLVMGVGVNTTINTTTVVADKGTTGENDPETRGTGGGADSGDNPILYLPNVIHTSDILNNFWNYGNFTVKGGDGGDGSENGYAAKSSTSNPNTSRFGIGGIYTNATTAPTGGTGIGSGGAGGSYSGGAGSGVGTNGAYCCGGGASNTGAAGGTGGTGLIQFTYVIN